MTYYEDNQEQDRGFSLSSLGQLAGGTAGGLASNPLVHAAANLQRRHPAEMVFLEVAAAGAMLYAHKQKKSRDARFRQEAEEDLRRRGWDGGAALMQQDAIRRQNSGLAPLQSPQNGQQRPLSAPPSQGWQSNRGDDDLAYGDYKGRPPVPQYQHTAQWDDDLAYGRTVEQHLPFGYVKHVSPPADQPYLPPQGSPPPPYAFPQQSPTSYSPQYQQQQQQQHQYGSGSGMPPLQHVQSYGPGGPPPQQPFPPYQGPPQWGAQPQAPLPGQYGYSPQSQGPY